MLSQSKIFPPIGSKWRDADRRAKRTVQVVRLDPDSKRVRIHCIETDILSWAKPEPFNGTSRGYIPLQDSSKSLRKR